jgi:hypothetical protein
VGAESPRRTAVRPRETLGTESSRALAALQRKFSWITFSRWMALCSTAILVSRASSSKNAR